MNWEQLLSLDQVAKFCQDYNVYFHTDTVQTITHYPFDLQKTPITFLSGSAHKFHGPKGIGFVYINKTSRLNPLVQWWRAGTNQCVQVQKMLQVL